MLTFNSACRLLVMASIIVLCSQAHGQLLSFLDDFGKPAEQQRDPFEERLETERHDFTQSAITVGRHVAQIEAGYTYFYKDNEKEIESSHTGPEMLMRVGLSEDIEVRLRWNYAWSFIDVEPDRTGSEDLRYSLKLQMTRPESCSYVPTSALEIRGSAPTGGEEFSTGKAEFSLDYIYQWEIGERITFAGSTGLGTNGFGDFGLVGKSPGEDNFTAISQSAVVGMELSEANVLYVEWYGIFSSGREDEYEVSVFNLGFDHYFTEDLVIDVRAGVGLTEDSDDFFTGVGGGFRF